MHNSEPEIEEVSFGRAEVGAEMGKPSQRHVAINSGAAAGAISPEPRNHISQPEAANVQSIDSAEGDPMDEDLDSDAVPETSYSEHQAAKQSQNLDAAELWDEIAAFGESVGITKELLQKSCHLLTPSNCTDQERCRPGYKKCICEKYCCAKSEFVGVVPQ